jgi:hypothetical protein
MQARSARALPLLASFLHYENLYFDIIQGYFLEQCFKIYRMDITQFHNYSPLSFEDDSLVYARDPSRMRNQGAEREGSVVEHQPSLFIFTKGVTAMADKKLDEHALESRKEVIIPIRLKELYKAYVTATFDKPIEWMQKLARGVDSIAIHKRMRTGVLAVATMPAGIILRNSARSANWVAEKKAPGVVTGVVGSAAAWYFGGKMAYAWATTHVPVLSTLATQTGVLASIAKVATVAATTVLTGFAVVPPALMLGTAAAAVAGAALIGTLSVVPAAFNLKTGLLRSWDRIRGIKDVDYDGAKEEQEISQNSLYARNERKEYSKISYGIRNLTEEHQKQLFDNLKEKFDQAAAANQNQPQPVAAPAAAAPAARKPTP